MKYWRAWALLVAAAAGCGGKEEAPLLADGSCQLELLAHLAPLPAAADPSDIRYTEVAARGGVAYLGTWQGEGVLVLDVASGETLMALEQGTGTINSVGLAGNWLAVAPRGAGLVVYDVSDPRRPARRAAAPQPARNCHTVFVHEDVVYCSTFSVLAPHLVAFRVSAPTDPTAPLELTAAGSYTVPRQRDEPEAILVHDLFVERKGDRLLAYLAYWERGLQIVDVTDPAAPALVGASPPTPGRWTHSVWVDGAYAYVAEESYKGLVRIYDVSNAAAPVEVGLLRSTEDAVSAHNVQVAGGFVYASWYQDGLRVFPAGGPTATGEVAYFHTWDGADNRDNPVPTDVKYSGDWDVFLDGGQVYASDTRTGLWVLRHHPAARACPSDRPRGTSAFARGGRPPFGFAGFAPSRLRPNRPFPLYAVISSVDDYFSTTDAVAATLAPSLEVTGAVMESPTEVIPSQASPPGPSRTLRRWTRLGAAPAGGAQLIARLTDDGAPRRVVRDLDLLPEPPPNEDVEPNEDDWVASILRPEPAGEVTVPGTVGPRDPVDVYLLEHPGGPLRIRLLGQDLSPPKVQDQASLALAIHRIGPGGAELARPPRQGVSAPARDGFDWEMVFIVPAGEPGPLQVSVAAAVPQPQAYRLELIP